MKHSIHNIVAWLLIIVALISGLLFYRQYQLITELRQNIIKIQDRLIQMPQLTSPSESGPLAPSSALDDKAPNMSNQGKVAEGIIQSSKSINGKILQIFDDRLSVNAQIVDLEAIKKIDQSQSAPIIKNYSVQIDKNTVFENTSQFELRVGDIIQVFSDKPVYSVDEFTATKIIFFLL